MSRVLLRCFVAAAAVFAVFAASGCGSEIGDSCRIGSDCSPNGDRSCDTSSRDGYCTILGCDATSCPEEATCVRFFSGVFENTSCDPAAADGCGVDEVCTLEGKCAPRANEVRYCMRTCSSSSDCRDGYECRDERLMQAHGGEPLRSPGDTGALPKFCAQAPI